MIAEYRPIWRWWRSFFDNHQVKCGGKKLNPQKSGRGGVGGSEEERGVGLGHPTYYGQNGLTRRPCPPPPPHRGGVVVFLSKLLVGEMAKTPPP